MLDPDRGRGRYAGEPVALGAPARTLRHRPWRTWIELADRLGLRLLTPRRAAPGIVRLAFERLSAARWQDDAPAASSEDRTERYGATSAYARIDKAEEPGFVLDLADALVRCKLPPSPRVLDLGVNDGDELALLMALSPQLAAAHFTGVDHSASALAVARARFSAAQVRLLLADLNDLAAAVPVEPSAPSELSGPSEPSEPPAPLGRFDLIVSFGTLQSPGVDDRQLLRRLVQHHLAPGGALILSLPNCRYFDGDLVHGARMRNFRQPELGLVVKDLAFYRKYLQQHDRQVFLTGHHTLLLTAVAR